MFVICDWQLDLLYQKFSTQSYKHALLFSICSRDERRWIERQNKAERQKRKKEEIMRIRTLVGKQYSHTPEH